MKLREGSMAEKSTNGNGATDAQRPDGQIPIQAKIVNQYIKDLSFEIPNVHKLVSGIGDQPNLQVEVNVSSQRVEGDLYESAIEFKATATNNIGTIYLLETVYAGMLKIESIPETALEPFLLISGPSMI